MTGPELKRIAVVGSGAAGLAAAWLLAQKHQVTLLEKDDHFGGHAHTATVTERAPAADAVAVDTGFIVYNEPCYPNLVRWFEAMGVDTADSDMSFAVSRGNGGFEYAGGPTLGLFAQPSLWLRPRYWSMLRGLLRFYREARDHVPDDSTLSLGEFLDQQGYSTAFVEDHLMPFAAAVWSSPASTMRDYPAAAFIRFCDNHGLLQVSNRPQWRTVTGGSQQYVRAVIDALGEENCHKGFEVSRLARSGSGVVIDATDGRQLTADHVVMATHADQALALLKDADDTERELLSAFAYEPNLAVLHTDVRLMPSRRRAWCSWNYVERNTKRVGSARGAGDETSVTYWMNRLQPLATKTDYFVTLNPDPMPAQEHIVRSASYAHPVFNASTWQAQQALWSLQGRRRTWFCGSYFGSGFHEDAVQSGLAIAEQLGGVSRPWALENASSRIVITPPDAQVVAGA